MDNNDIDINDLIQKYEQMRYMDKNIYFDADEFAMLADYYNDFGDTSEAEHIVEIGLGMHPGSSELMIVKAKVLVMAEKYEEAYKYLSTIAEDETNVDFLLVRFECLLNLDKTEEANSLLDVVLNGNELDDDELYTFLTEVGYLYNDADKYETAIMLLEKALKMDDSNVEVLVDMSYSYEMLDNIEKSIELNNAILDIDPYLYDAWVNLGKLYSMNQNHSKAIEAYDFALTINDDDVNVLKMKALSHYLNDNVEEAVRIFNECLSDSPDDESLYEALLEGYEAMEQYDEMLKVIDQKEEKFGSKGVLLQRAHIYLNQERYEEAQEIFNKIPNEDKDSFDYYILKGELAIHNEDYETAETSYILAMMDSPDDEFTINKLANISLEQGNYEKSAEYLELLISLNANFPTAKIRLAFLRFEIGAKEPFDEIMSQFSDEELRELLNLIIVNDETGYSDFDRKKLLTRLNEARENRVLFKNIKY